MLRCARLAISLLLCACGDGANGKPPDAPFDPNRGTVHVRVLDPNFTGAPSVGAIVVFLDPDGSLVRRVMTDGVGSAEAEVLPGASVTSIARKASGYQITYLPAIEPGDDIVMGIKLIDATTTGTFTVSWPLNPGAVTYSIAHPCGTRIVRAPAASVPPPTTVLFEVNERCKQDPMELIVTANDSREDPINAITRSGVPFVNGGSTTLTGEYQELVSLTGAYTNIHPIVTSVEMRRSVPDELGIESHDVVQPLMASESVQASGPAASTAQIVTSTFAGDSLQVFREVQSGTASTYDLDLATALLPWIGLPSYDATARKLVIPIDPTGASPDNKPDLLRVAATYVRTDANNVTTRFSWVLFSPEAGDIALPTLPPELGDIGPLPSDTVIVEGAGMFDADAVTSYDQLRGDAQAKYSGYFSSRPITDRVRTSRSPH